MFELPRVTIGVPTYLRPELLRRCLTSVACQDYPAIEVVVSDNATPGELVREVVDSFRDRISNLHYVRQHENIGARSNLLSILRDADTDYFMWLADDDEISPNYVSSLVSLLEADPAAVSAAGHWQLKRASDQNQMLGGANFPQRSTWGRVRRFIWNSNDYFFYGLHRTSALKRATFKKYWWPNHEQLQNWAYLFLLDLVIDGKILVSDDQSVRFIMHAYAPKTWRIRQGKIVALVRGFVRRINLHWLMFEKIARRASLGLALAALPIMVTRLGLEGIRNIVSLARAAIRKVFRHLRRNRSVD